MSQSSLNPCAEGSFLRHPHQAAWFTANRLVSTPAQRDRFCDSALARAASASCCAVSTPAQRDRFCDGALVDMSPRAVRAVSTPAQRDRFCDGQSSPRWLATSNESQPLRRGIVSATSIGATPARPSNGGLNPCAEGSFLRLIHSNARSGSSAASYPIACFRSSLIAAFPSAPTNRFSLPLLSITIVVGVAFTPSLSPRCAPRPSCTS